MLLKQAERHVATGQGHVDRQRRIIADIERRGGDTTQAYDVLGTFETSQELFVEDRDRFAKALDLLG